MQCALCPNKGGPMKPSSVLLTDDLLIEIGTGMTEKAYQNRIKKCMKTLNKNNEENSIKMHKRK